MQKPKVIVILGTTATGKSDLAVKIAKKMNGEIISADSRQVYKGLDIGTGKVFRDKKISKSYKLKAINYLHKGIPHHLIDVANPKRKFTVAEYQKKAIYAMAEIVKKGKTPIICGGTGFYIDAITKGTIFPQVPPNIKLRKLLEKKSVSELLKMLEKLDKKRAKDIKDKNEINNKVRLIRAIEIAKALNKVPKITQGNPVYEFIKIGLYLPQEKLKKKIEKRVKKMFADGLLNEIKKLKKPARRGESGVSQKRLSELGFEYNNPTYERVVKESVKYAKRQMTWFKRDKEIKWFDASTKNLEKSVLSKLKKDF
ncbi:tRNA (adenosine(37)-N6)-dimethylallyltransferase MiaA [Candidatus Nomurabacteria bacterium CG22_combo_CG10-13_8_21_14_all_32_8]|uniref:tRNA dimethylallyltransferase n=1 Tax=Candidatus Nomurabacteria bacterium CG22_combo_CG10-13_8_21_14_all_32_8 TaxID=1974732 RepID=A0A2H0CFQ1_9BACT|nr:MAG: tRNA (adenosine(37)-N6)-dimethylallyltransferase MiaA [Candidatus Nomurabacteria bacterium CG22_combo_CG10-13_8_21_14_all_32_8]